MTIPLGDLSACTFDDPEDDMPMDHDLQTERPSIPPQPARTVSAAAAVATTSEAGEDEIQKRTKANTNALVAEGAPQIQ